MYKELEKIINEVFDEAKNQIYAGIKSGDEKIELHGFKYKKIKHKLVELGFKVKEYHSVYDYYLDVTIKKKQMINVKEELENLEKITTDASDFYEDSNGIVQPIPIPKKKTKDLSPEQLIEELRVRQDSFEKMISGEIRDLKNMIRNAFIEASKKQDAFYDEDIKKINKKISNIRFEFRQFKKKKK